VTARRPHPAAGPPGHHCGRRGAATTSATYALGGPVLAETDFNGAHRIYTHNSARRLKLVNYPGTAPDVGYAWDKHGRRTSMAEDGATVATYSYDE